MDQIGLIPEEGGYDEIKAAVLCLYEPVIGFAYRPSIQAFRLTSELPSSIGMPITLPFDQACRYRANPKLGYFRKYMRARYAHRGRQNVQRPNYR